MNAKLINNLIDNLKSDEGWDAFAYQDHLGYWTIGYGFLIDPQKGGGLPRHIGEIWLKYAAEIRYEELRKRLPWLDDMPESVQRALGNMAYQMGVHGVLGFPNMLQSLQDRDWEAAADHGLDSEWFRDQTPERAKRVTDLIRDTVV